MIMPKKAILKRAGSNSIANGDENPKESFSHSVNPGFKRSSGLAPGFSQSQSHRRPLPDMDHRERHNFDQGMHQFAPQNFRQTYQRPAPDFGRSMQQYPPQMAPSWCCNPMGPCPQPLPQLTDFGTSLQQPCQYSIPSLDDDFSSEDFCRSVNPGHKQHVNGNHQSYRRMQNFGHSMQQCPPPNIGQSMQQYPPTNFNHSVQQFPSEMASNWGYPMRPFPLPQMQPTLFGSSFQMPHQHHFFHCMESTDDYPDEPFAHPPPPPKCEASDEKKFSSEEKCCSVARFFTQLYESPYPAEKYQLTPSKGRFDFAVPDLPTSSTPKAKNSDDSCVFEENLDV
ncbi:hypothetical protein L596_001575 [Steinernema carpocapsae]|uniref:Uncharacterized protein n=1 Tax=Steinernema carpocapsae TaxID=34508 RepID=A0A4U8ULX4_STECR|nr:hypothetical protein L596_001575 [Steinernema carpocapsae]